MRTTAALLVIASSTLLAGCFGPKLAPLIAEPTKPASLEHSVQFTVEAKDARPERSRYVQSGSPEQAPRLSSKVVININTDVREKIFCIERPDAGGCNAKQRGAGAGAGASESDSINRIDTTAFVSDTERQLEKELIKAGFRVINRARLEAKLREMRDSRDDCKGYFYTYSADCLSRLPDDIRRLLDLYRQERAAGKLSDAEFLRKTEELRERYQVSSAGKRRDANEMTDVSEVIRAAKDGDVGADYILLINGFNVQPSKRVINLLAVPEVREFAKIDPSANAWVNENQYKECLQSSVGLDASLVHVKTGEVVWIGEHKVSEDMLTGAQDPLRFLIEYSKFVGNHDEVSAWVRQQNTQQARIQRYRMANQPKQPDWKWYYKAKMDVVGGRCPGANEPISPDKLEALTELVASELISTIRIQP